MNQFDKNQIIVFKLNDIHSIRRALIEYQTLLNSGKAFLHQIFDVEFKVKTADGIRRLQAKDTKNTVLLKKALGYGPEDFYTERPIGDEDEIYISEPIFFAIALEHADMLDEVVKTAQAMVKEMRRLNDTSDVWVDDMRVFGAEALYMLALSHPQYAYLLAQYLIPYWDLEHAVGYEAYLFNLVEKYGWTRDLLKAYIWCDNGHFRYHMYALEDQYLYNEEEIQKGNPNPGEYLQQNPEEYAWFKQAIEERFKTEPVLLYSHQDEPEEQNPILELYLTLHERYSPYYDEDASEEILQSHFVHDTLENEALDLQLQVAKAVNGPLVKFDEGNQLTIDSRKFFDEDVYKGDGTRDLKEFILALSMGEQIWTYIESENSTEILDRIEQTELLPIAKEHAKRFYMRMTYFISPLAGEADLNEELSSILSNVTYDHLHEEDDEDETSQDLGNGFVSKITVAGTNYPDAEDEKLKRHERYLRILDVFYRLLGVKQLSNDIKDIVADPEDEPLMTVEEFYQRYSKTPPKKRKEKKYDLNSYSFGSAHNELDQDALKYVENALKQLGREAYDCSSWSKNKLGKLALASYLLSKDRAAMHFDEYSQKLLEFISEGPWEMAFKQLSEHLATDQMTKEELELVENYFTSPQVPQADQETILKLLKTHLYREECYRGPLTFNKYCKNQDSYSLLWYGDSYQHVLLCCYWMRNLMPPQSFHADRIWKLLVALAPQRVITLIGRLFSDDYSVVEFNDSEIEERFYADLQKAKIPIEHLYAFQMVQSQDKHSIADPCNVKEYLHWLDLYDEIDDEEGGMIGAHRKKKALALEKGMHFINETSRIRYYRDLSLRNPRFPFQQDEEFARCLNIFLQLNAKDRENIDADALTKEVLRYLEGDLAYDKIKQAFDMRISRSNMSTSPETIHMYSLGQFFWLLDRDKQDRLMTLLLNHSVEGFEIIEYGIMDAYQSELIKSGELAIEDFLSFSEEMPSDELDEYLEAIPQLIIDRVSKLDIDQNHWIAYILEQEQPQFMAILLSMARSGQLEQFINKAGVSQRVKLALAFREEEDAKELLRNLKNDKSRKVRDLISE